MEIKPHSERMIQRRNHGHPTITKEKIDIIVRDLSNGIPRQVSLDSVGVALNTWKDWLKQGKLDLALGDNDTLYAYAASSLGDTQKATFDAELAKIREDKGNHKGSAWFLKHCYPRYFSDDVQYAALVEEIEDFADAELQAKVDQVRAERWPETFGKPTDKSKE